MAGLRWRGPAALTLLVVFALCFSLQQAPPVAAKDKSKSGKAASTADDDSNSPADSGNAGATEGKSAKKKAKTPARKEKAKKGKQGTEESGTSPSATPSGSSTIPSVPGGQPAGNSPENTKAAGNQRAVGAAARRPAVAGKANAGAAKAQGQPAAWGRLDANHPMVKKVIGIQNRMTPDLMKQKGIVGTSTGLDEDGNVVIRVQITGADSPTIPKQVEGVAVVEVLTGPIHPYWQQSAFNQQARQPRPVPIGTSAFDDVLLAPGLCAAGTLGCRLRDRQGNVYALSNNHVFAGENGLVGNVVIGTPVVQPSPGDNNCTTGIITDQLGVLFKFKPIDFNGGPNVIDCAVISTDVSLVSNSTPLAPVAYGTPRTTTWIGPFLGLKVQKLGRTSAYTTGAVIGLNQIGFVGYGVGIALFVDQIEFSGINAPSLGSPGDSGSLIVTNDFLGERFPVGLLFAGGGGITLGNPIQTVLDFFDMTIDGDGTPITPLPGKQGRAGPDSP